MWIVLLKSSADTAWLWATVSDEHEAERIFASAYPSLYQQLKPLEAKLRKRQDRGRHWWELRPSAYYDAFEGPKLTYQEIQFHPAFGYDRESYFGNNRVFIVPSGDLYLLAVLNSPLMWWHNWRFLPRMKDDALSPLGVLMETLPIAQPDSATRAEVEPAVERLITLTRDRRALTGALLAWLRVEFAIEVPGQRLEAFGDLDEEAFIEEVRRHRPRSAGRLSPAALADLRVTFAAESERMRANQREAGQLERRLAALVNGAYGLTPAEIDLLWRTAPPRMPIASTHGVVDKESV